jgi:hypothetical protein
MFANKQHPESDDTESDEYVSKNTRRATIRNKQASKLQKFIKKYQIKAISGLALSSYLDTVNLQKLQKLVYTINVTKRVVQLLLGEFIFHLHVTENLETLNSLLNPKENGSSFMQQLLTFAYYCLTHKSEGRLTSPKQTVLLFKNLYRGVINNLNVQNELFDSSLGRISELFQPIAVELEEQLIQIYAGQIQELRLI